MGRSAKVTRTVGLRALKNAKKGAPADPACVPPRSVRCAVATQCAERERQRQRASASLAPAAPQLTAGWCGRHTRAGVIKPVNATKMRRRKEKAERIKAALEEEAEARRQARKSVLAKREKDGAKATVTALPH
eukprot:COSAG01_NODE_3076_length_6633_cov_13.203857_3_plen_133_part_00